MLLELSGGFREISGVLIASDGTEANLLMEICNTVGSIQMMLENRSAGFRKISGVLIASDGTEANLLMEICNTVGSIQILLEDRASGFGTMKRKRLKGIMILTPGNMVEQLRFGSFS